MSWNIVLLLFVVVVVVVCCLLLLLLLLLLKSGEVCFVPFQGLFFESFCTEITKKKKSGKEIFFSNLFF